MGSIRTLLAIAVVFAHSYGFVFVGGKLAVQLFYIISGFLISFVITEAQTYTSVKSFYLNRFLRIFPVYWTVAIIALAGKLIAQFVFNENSSLVYVYTEIDWLGRLSLTFSNVFLFGQDWIMFTGVREGVFQFVSDFNKSEVNVYQGLIVPQAWTLGLELSFYLIAPFVLTRKKILLSIIAASLLLRAILVADGIGQNDPWDYRFFPSEIALFLLGAVSHQMWTPYLKENGWLTENTTKIVTVFAFIYCSIYFVLPNRELNTLVLIGVFLTALPFLFEFQKTHKWDATVGDLSYPIYISHVFVIWAVGALLERFFSIEYKSLLGSMIILYATVLFSILLNKFVGAKVNDLRNSVKSKQLMKSGDKAVAN